MLSRVKTPLKSIFQRTFATRPPRKMKIAVEGCCHGELDNIYKEIKNLEQKNDYKVDLLLICGDFQAVRNLRDLQSMAVPSKYKKLETFHKYYTGEQKAPILTVIIGGNHEASNYFYELYHGGWVAPNIYYLGNAGCVQANGIRIAGASGIFKQYNFRAGHYEKPPYDGSTVRSAYHLREYATRRLSLLTSPEIVISHDWPQGIEHHGNLPYLLKQKPGWKDDIRSGTIGAPPLMELLRTLKPEWWFAAHMHVKFDARVEHPAPPIQKVNNPDEIMIDDDEDFDSPPTSNEPAAAAASPPPPSTPARRETRFVALDKCLPNRKFLEVVDVPAPGGPSDPTLTFDPEWLAITRAFAPLFSAQKHQGAFPIESVAREKVAKELEWVKTNIGLNKPVDSCQTFVMTAPGPGSEGDDKHVQPPFYPNPQTSAFCKMLQIKDNINSSANTSRN